MAVPPPHSAHAGSAATGKMRKRGRPRRTPGFDDAASPRRALPLSDKLLTVTDEAAREQEKPALRARLRAERDAAAGAPFPPPPAFLARLSPGQILASYVPVGGEADPALFDAAALAAGCRLVLPHVVDRATPLRFLAWAGDAALVAGPFGLRQPAADLPELAPDIILTPLVGFDRSGNRLGQGAAHYDRAFAAHPAAWRVGLAWSVQEIGVLTPDPWDVPLHAIATEKEWITP